MNFQIVHFILNVIHLHQPFLNSGIAYYAMHNVANSEIETCTFRRGFR